MCYTRWPNYHCFPPSPPCLVSNRCTQILEWGQMKERVMQQPPDVNWFHMTEAGCAMGINVSCWHPVSSANTNMFRKITSQRGHCSEPRLLSFQGSYILYSWFGSYFQYILRGQPMMLALLSFGNIRICLPGESKRLFVSLKINHAFDPDCARLSTPPWNPLLRAGGKEHVLRETEGTTIVYRTLCIFHGDKKTNRSGHNTRGESLWCHQDLMIKKNHSLSLSFN